MPVSILFPSMLLITLYPACFKVYPIQLFVIVFPFVADTAITGQLTLKYLKISGFQSKAIFPKKFPPFL